MTAIGICVLAFVVSFVAGKRSRSVGVITVLVFGYAYGILRANLLTYASHFIFDCVVLGLYAAELGAAVSTAQRAREYHLREWVVALVLLPALLLLLPKQDALVQLVGFRGAVLFLPFVLIGARLNRAEFMRLAIGVAVLNIAVFGVALYEYFVGVTALYPLSPVTYIIYRSRDILNYAYYRIPATFSSSAAYAGTMIFTLPLITKGMRGRLGSGTRVICAVGVAVALIGVFLSASRTGVLLTAIVVGAMLFDNRKNPRSLAILVAAGIGVAALVATQPRMQRFMSLSDKEYVAQRMVGSMNLSTLDVVSRYPFGNGLGAGGTSLPYFLQNRVKNVVTVENEYGRLILEEGALGFALWVCFAAWVLIRTGGASRIPGKLPIQVAIAATFLSGFTGTGFLTAIPSTAFLFLLMGSLLADWSSTAVSGTGNVLYRIPTGRSRTYSLSGADSAPPLKRAPDNLAAG
jgi:hypothetical protein